MSGRLRQARLAGAGIIVAAALGLSPGAIANDLDAVMRAEEGAIRLAQASQGRIDEVVQENTAMTLRATAGRVTIGQ